MLSKSQIKLIRSLEHRKFRNETGLFIAEGEKIANDLLTQGWPVEKIYATEDSGLLFDSKKTELISPEEMQKISLLKTPATFLTLCRMCPTQVHFPEIKNSLTLALDDVQDPGNVGTIIRIADWFGIGDIFCGSGTADVYNPKVIQATMGAFTRVRVHEVDLEEFIPEYKKHTENPVFGTLLEGGNMYGCRLRNMGLIVMGSEGKGIHTNLRKLLDDSLYIPPYGETPSSESLNVAVATAIVCAEFRRQFPG